MNRRGLFQGFAAAASGLLVPEPIKSYFFAPVCGWTGRGFMDVPFYVLSEPEFVGELLRRYDMPIGRIIENESMSGIREVMPVFRIFYE